MTNTPLKYGEPFWWFSDPRRLLVVRCHDSDPDGLQIWWEYYLGLRNYGDPIRGEVFWTLEEWNAAHLIPYQEPVRRCAVPDGREVCPLCRGSRWETCPDFEILTCMCCGSEGHIQRREPLPPRLTRRSPLHPEVLTIEGERE